MTQIIEIEGDLVRVVERSLTVQANLADVLPLIERKIPVSTLIPKSAVFMTLTQNGPQQTQGFLCEIPPGVKVITKISRRFRLAMPWTYMWFTMTTTSQTPTPSSWSLQDYRCFHTNQPVTGMDSRLWTAFLPNVYEDGRICFGSTGASATLPIHQRIDTLVNTWYQTAFNNDVHGGRNHPLPFNGTLPNGWREWARRTREEGAIAWTRFPEWDVTDSSNGATSFTVEQVIAAAAQGRRQPVTVRDEIPELPMPASFGRVEEWLMSLDSNQRARIMRGITNIATERPAAIAPLPVETDLGDDGGEEV